MASSAAVLQAEIDKSEVNMSRLDAWLNDTTGTLEVPIDVGTVPSLMKIILQVLATVPVTGYTTQTALLADLTPGDKRVAYAGDTENEFIKSGASGTGSWTAAGTSKIASIIKALQRVIVPGGSVRPDPVGALNTASVVYVPRLWFIDSPGVAASNLTVTNADSTELPGWAKMTYSTATRAHIYLDIAGPTLVVIQATAGDFTLPTGLPASYVQVYTINTGATSAPYSQFAVQNLTSATARSGFIPASPIVHSRFGGKVLIPSGALVSSAGVTTHAIADGSRYEEFDVAAGTSMVTYWFDTVNNLYKATTAGLAPFQVHESIGVVIGWSRNGVFYSPWPSVCVDDRAVGVNEFDHTDDPGNAPFIQLKSTSAVVTLTNTDALSLGVTKGMTNSLASNPWPGYGFNILDPKRPQGWYLRMGVVTPVGDNFASPRLTLVNENNGLSSIGLTLEKKFSSSFALWSGAGSLPDPAAASVAGTKWVFGFGSVIPPASTFGYQVCDVQWATSRTSAPPQWIERDDRPVQAAVENRVAALEAKIFAAGADPDPWPLQPTSLYLVEGRPLQLHFDNLFEPRVFAPAFRATFESAAGATDLATVSTTGGRSFTRPVPDRGALEVSTANVGPVYRLVCRKDSDGLPGATRPNRHFVGDFTTVRSAKGDQRTAGVATPLTFQGWGDSLNGNTHHFTVLSVLQDMGFAVTMQGTIGVGLGSPNEGRGGDSFEALIGRFVDSASVGQKVIAPGTAAWNAYMALPDNDPVLDCKVLYNPLLRASTGADPSYRVFRTASGSPVTIDVQNYLTRAGFAAPDVFVFGLGTGDLNHYPTDTPTAVARALEGIGIILDVIRAQFGAGKKVIFWFPSIPRGNGTSGSQDASETRWGAQQVPMIKAMTNYYKTRADANVGFAPAYLTVDPVAPWSGNGVAGKEVVVSTDALTGARDVDWLDNIHYDGFGRRGVAEEISAAVAWHCGQQL